MYNISRGTLWVQSTNLKITLNCKKSGQTGMGQHFYKIADRIWTADRIQTKRDKDWTRIALSADVWSQVIFIVYFSEYNAKVSPTANTNTRVFSSLHMMLHIRLWYYNDSSMTHTVWLILYESYLAILSWNSFFRSKSTKKKLKECFVRFVSAVQGRPFRGSKGHLGSF